MRIVINKGLIYLKYIFIMIPIMVIANSCTQPSTPSVFGFKKVKTIAIQPFDGIPNRYINEATETLEAFYGCEIVTLPSVTLPQSAYYPPRDRYRADTLIRYLRDTKTKEYDKIIGLTHRDISTTKGEYKDWGIMGLGFRPGASCVVSTFRIKRGARSETHTLERFRKVVIHEVGHTLGLPHCDYDKRCLMKDAKGKVSTVDTAEEMICQSCKKKIQHKVASTLE